MKTSLSVTVLVSAGRNPLSGAPRACKGDAVALAAGRALAGDAVRVVHAGDASDPALKDYLAYGAGSIDVIPVRGPDTVVSSLAAALAGSDLILTGIRAETAAGSGMLPYALAEALNRPLVPNILDIARAGEELELRQFLPKGKRRRLAVALPAILTLHPLAPVTLHYAYARRVGGRIETVPPARTEPASTQGEAVAWTVSDPGRPLVRLKADEKKGAHARLQSALGGEAKRGVVVSEGSDADKARVLLAYLRENKLVEF